MTNPTSRILLLKVEYSQYQISDYPNIAKIRWFGEWMTHFKRAHMSCFPNSLSAQVKLYVPVVTTGNANAANKALTIGRVCVALKKYTCPWWWNYNRLYRHLHNVLGILLSGGIVSLEKHPVFSDWYRLALGRASSSNILLQYIIWQFSVQFSVKEVLETTIEVAPNGRVGVTFVVCKRWNESCIC